GDTPPAQADVTAAARLHALYETLSRRGDRVAHAARARRRARSDALGSGVPCGERPVAHRRGDLLVRLPERNPSAHELLGDVGGEQEWVGDGLGEPLPARGATPA